MELSRDRLAVLVVLEPTLSVSSSNMSSDTSVTGTNDTLKHTQMVVLQ